MHPEIDKFAHLESHIHNWDPRLKIFSLFFYIFTISAINNLIIIFFCFCSAVILTFISKIPVSFVFKRLRWVMLFLLPFFIILPFTDGGKTLFYLFTLPINSKGLYLGTLVYLRALTVVILIFPTFGTTPFDITIKAIQRLKVPEVLVQIFLISYRYIFVFLEEMQRMHTAILARGFRMQTNLHSLKTIGNFVGMLLVRSFERTDWIYRAMWSRGYNGNLQTFYKFNVNSYDILKSTFFILLSLALIWTDKIL
ncbi:MAG: cobalt ECF transporter T component CbiQ [bacterium]